MILYQSTRGDHRRYKFSEVVLRGIAPDGGLFIPTKIPKLSVSDLKFLVGKTYQQLCFHLMNFFETDFSESLLKKIIHKAYASNFAHPEIAPLIHLKDDQYILELWHGPTSAFKDLALQIMPYFFVAALKVKNKERIKSGKKSFKYLILVATSGDTGKAALEGYKDQEGISIKVFYPFAGISSIRKLSMTTQEGNNVEVIGMNGDFDDVQRSIKEVFNDQQFNEKLQNEYNTVLSSANSINWGRLFPQIVYHLLSYLELVKKKIIKLGEEIDIAVPTGNFGNILAAFYVKEMGLPIRKLICASNANNVLTKFLQKGVYDISKRNLIKTPSPSMDIIIAGNIERLLYEITKNPKQVSSWMKQLNLEEKFTIDEKTLLILHSIFYADWVSNADCLDTIKSTYRATDYLLDPHTAVAQAVAERFQMQNKSDIPIIICSTAHWSKFPQDVYRALAGVDSPEDEFTLIDEIKKLIPDATIPRNIKELKDKKIIHHKKCNIGEEEVKNKILEFFKN